MVAETMKWNDHALRCCNRSVGDVVAVMAAGTMK